MKKAEIPANEDKRLVALYALQILDTKAEERFDRITRMVSQILQMPVSLVSLVDKERQWFKSIVGLDAKETSREVAFCAHAILQKGIMEVENALEDERFFDNPLVTSAPNIRFYAGYPLSAPGGEKVGTLCIIDKKPRKLSESEKTILKDFGQLVERELAIKEVLDLQKKMEEEVRKQDLLKKDISSFFELSIDMLCIAGFDGYFKKLNPSWSKLLGWSIEELLARPYLDFVHPEDRESTIKEASALSRGAKTVRFQNRYLCKDLSYIWLCWNASPTLENNKIYAVARNITDVKEVEKMKNEFISMVSHELRTPLTSIKGSLDLILGGAVGEISEDLSELVQMARNNSNRLILLINDLLDLQKIESGKMDFKCQQTDLCQIAKRSIEEMQGFAEQYKIKYSLERDIEKAMAYVDTDRLNQVFINLLSNATKFSPPGETVTMKISLPGEKILIEIKDKGPGIPKEAQKELFNKFYQVDSSTTRQKGGTGLGLSICKAITERMQGEVGFETEEGKGSTFYVKLPCSSFTSFSHEGKI